MPPPFVIDLTTPASNDEDESIRLDVVECGDARTASVIRLAALRCGVPEHWYRENDSAYQLVNSRADVLLDVTRTAIRAAAKEGAAIVAFPEAFLPAAVVDELPRLASDLGVIIVGGVEMHRDRHGVLNRAVTALPGGDVFEQVKQRPSVYEVRANEFASDGQLRKFRSTVVGSFAVVVCSDYLEHDLMSLVESDGHVDLYIVCARNPNPDVFSHLAAADAYRRYANVVIVNCRPDSDTGQYPASGDGTLVAAPRRDAPFLQPVDTVTLGFAEEFQPHEPPSLSVFELGSEAIAHRNHNRPDHGFISAPHFARRS